MEEKKSFETAMKELEETVKKLEDPRVPLEQALRLYEKGLALKKFCSDLLDKAKMKLEKIDKDSKVTDL